jgi:hypothetical protein
MKTNGPGSEGPSADCLALPLTVVGRKALIDNSGGQYNSMFINSSKLSPFSQAEQLVQNFSTFCETRSSLPCPHQSDSTHDPQLEESYLFDIKFNIVLTSISRSSKLSPSSRILYLKDCMHFCSPPYVSRSPPISFLAPSCCSLCSPSPAAACTALLTASSAHSSILHALTYPPHQIICQF